MTTDATLYPPPARDYVPAPVWDGTQDIHTWIAEHWADYATVEVSSEEPVESPFADKQHRLLIDQLHSSWQPPEGNAHWTAVANVGLFYQMGVPPLVPDVMVSLDVQWRDSREGRAANYLRSYFLWIIGKPPEVVIELVSREDNGELGRKYALYAAIGIPYYIVYDPLQTITSNDLHVFERNAAGEYALRADNQCPALGLGVVRWHGQYEDLETEEHALLRWCDVDGHILPTGAEKYAAQQQELAAERAQRAAQQQELAAERARLAAERARAEKLAAQLRALGVDPDSLR